MAEKQKHFGKKNWLVNLTGDNVVVVFLDSKKMSGKLLDVTQYELILKNIEPLMTKVTRFLGIEHTCKRISLLTAVSLIYQAIPVVPTVFDDWI
ncbi:hypothetical protein I8R59_29005 [Klebsiella pneumoniae]|nr:hypothetical protein [Klebsiella pneumoniae]